MQLLTTSLLATLPLFLSPVTRTAQEMDSAPATPQIQSTFVLEAGEHALEDLVDRSAAYLNRNHLVQWDFGKRKASMPMTVVLQERLELDARGCEEVVSQLMFSCGWVFTPVDEGRGIYEWINREGENRETIYARPFQMTFAELQRRQGLKAYVSVTMGLDHYTGRTISTALSPFLKTAGRQGALNVIPFDHSVTLIGFTDSVLAAARLVHGAEVSAASHRHNQPTQPGAPAGARKNTKNSKEN